MELPKTTEKHIFLFLSFNVVYLSGHSYKWKKTNKVYTFWTPGYVCINLFTYVPIDHSYV